MYPILDVRANGFRPNGFAIEGTLIGQSGRVFATIKLR